MFCENKKIDECIKRTLLYSCNYESINYKLCFNCSWGYNNISENICDGNTNHRSHDFAISDECKGCVLCKKFKTFPQVFHYLKALIVLGNNGRGESIVCRDILDAISRLLTDTRRVCYLTFSEREYLECWDRVKVMNFKELAVIVKNINDYCEENNLK